ncbi:O-antigen ligase family protein [Niallia taxi]|uniref:O-antigen ligase family protein n=1 Tax=Niallia taxi TaxID=2499688 RepID=UPI00300A8738
MEKINLKETQGRLIIKTLILIFFLISISLISYDKLPFLHYSSYSPSSIFTFFGAFVLILLLGYKPEGYDKWLLIFIGVSIVHSVLSALYYDNIGKSFSHIVTLVVGFSVFITVRYAFSNKKANSNLYENILVLSMIIPLFLGFLQFLNQMGLHLAFINNLTSLLAYKAYDGRIQMASSEPSWAAVHILTIGAILLYKSKRKPIRRLVIAAMAFLFLMTFSSYGYGVFLLSLLIFGLITKKSRMKVILSVVALLSVVFFVVPYVLDIFDVNSYFNQRFNYKYIFSQEFLQTDASGFIRIIFPVIGLLEFLHFPIGYGGGFYYVHFNEYLVKYFSYGLVFEEVQENYFVPGTATARNLFAKILSEEGFFQFIFFLLFLRGIFKKATSAYGKYVLCLAIAFLANFDTYAFVNFWFLLGVVSSGYFNKEQESSVPVQSKNSPQKIERQSA